ncbi:MAG: response regulator [Desulfatibacillaceae bacterium]
MASAGILIVDRDQDVRTFAKNLLGAAGYRVHEAASADEGMAAASARRPDLVILEVMMPDCGGLRMYGRLLNDEKLRRIPVVLVSHLSPETFSHYRTTQGFLTDQSVPEPQAYLEKPLEKDELLYIVERLLTEGIAKRAARGPRPVAGPRRNP